MARAVAVLGAACLLALPAAGAAEGVSIVVTTPADAVNGDTSSAPALAERPGPDGVSLREALEVTNRSPGRYAIGFAPVLRGRTIAVRGEELPVLAGGGVTLDGDVNGDGRPDVTLRGNCRTLQWGIAIGSSGNTVRRLALRSCSSGVYLVAGPRGMPTGRTIARNTVEGLDMDVCQNAVWLGATGQRNCERSRCVTRNRWLDTRIAGNTIRTRFSGIELQLASTSGDRIERLTIDGNRIAFATKGGEFTSGYGVHVLAGAGYFDSRGNRISGVEITRNRITGNPSGGVRIAVGDTGADANSVQKVRISGNRFAVRPAAAGYLSRSGVIVAAGDSCSDWLDKRLRPLRCPERNTARDIEISGNTMGDGAGVTVFAGVGGATGNSVRGVRILRNTIGVRLGGLPGITAHTLPGVLLMAGIGQATTGKPTSGNRIHDVTIAENRVSLAPGQRPPAGIILLGGRKPGATGNSLTCVRVSGNRVSGFPQPVLLASGLEDAGRNTATYGGC